MEQRDTSIVSDLWRTALLNLALLLAYVAAGKFGLAFFGLIHPSASAVWLPTGISIGALLVFGRWMWPAIFADAAAWLRDQGAALVGIDSHNIDDTRSPNARPVHTILLAAEILIVEHLRGLEQLPDTPFRFSAVPPKITGYGDVSGPCICFAVGLMIEHRRSGSLVVSRAR